MSPRLWSVAALGLASLGLAAPAAGYHGDKQFAAPAAEGGGGGIYYTGSPRARGYQCGACHVRAPGESRLAIASDPGSLLTTATYTPDEVYSLTISLTRETRGQGSARNYNTLALEILDAGGEAVGGFFGFDGDLMRTQDDGGVLFAQGRDDVVEWSFQWQAPAAGAGHLDVYVAAVDGDGAGQADPPGATDPFGDDVMASAFRLAEEGVPAPELVPPGEVEPEDTRDVTGCRLAGPAPVPAALALLLFLSIFSRRRRRRPARPLIF